MNDDGAASLSRILFSEESLDSVLRKVAHLAHGTLGGADAVSVTLVHAGRATTAVATDALALEVDEIQYATDEGPCLDAARSRVVRRVDDMATDTRWPRFAPEAAARGVGSSLSVPLPVREHVLGAMNIYARVPGAYADEDVELARTFAAHAAVALANAQLYTSTARLAEQLNAALASRAVIEQAKGVVMARQRCTPDEAFAVLRDLSQRQNVKLRDVAAHIVADASFSDGDDASA